MNPFIYFLTGLLISIGASYTLTRIVIAIAKRKQLYDTNNCIKKHSEMVCALGGAGIFSAFWITVFLAGYIILISDLLYLFAGSLVLFLAGVKDDLSGVPALRRLVIQVAVATLLFFNGIQISTLPGMESTLPGLASYLITVFFIVAVLNAYNFIDGINGLAGGLGVISGLTFFGLFAAWGDAKLAILAISLAGALIGFLCFNFGKARIFMGDNGSTFIGLMLAWFSITFLSGKVQENTGTLVSPLFFLAILFVPLADMVKVVLGRLWSRRSPFKGDRTHIHHVLACRGLKAKNICLLLFGWQSAVIVFSLFLLPGDPLNAIAMLSVIAGLPYFIFFLRGRTRESKKPDVIKTNKTKKQLESIPSNFQ